MVEEIPHVRSATIGVWVGAGSRYEEPAEAGITHFIEHLLFKGTERRSAKEIAEEVDALGASLNAFTAKEYTCYYAKVLDEQLETALDLLADMLQHSVFDAEEMEKERGVVLEEIKLYEDTPDDLVHDLLTEQAWHGHPLGRVITGTTASVEGFDHSQVLDYFHRYYTAGNTVVAIAGNVQAEAAIEAVGRWFAGLSQGTSPLDGSPARLHPGRLLRLRETEQVHLCLALPGVPQDDDAMYPLYVLNTILGGSSSSRLFQEIRENRGLAYSVYSYLSAHRDSGLLAVYAGCSDEAAPTVLELVLEQLAAVADGDVTAAEVERAKSQMKGQLVLGLESTSNRMNRIGRSLLSRGRVLTLDEVLNKLSAVGRDDVDQLARRLMADRRVALAAIGPDLGAVADIPLAF